MPRASDQKKGAVFPFDSVLSPTTSPAALIPRGVVDSPPNVPMSRVPPAVYQIMPRLQRPEPDVQGTCAVPTRSPAPLAPNTMPGRSSSCSTCQAPLTLFQRTGRASAALLRAAPPATIVPSPLTALATVQPSALRRGRSSLQAPGCHTAAVLGWTLRSTPTTSWPAALIAYASPNSP